MIRSTTARGQATRARADVALAALLPGVDEQLIDFYRPFKLCPTRVQRPQEALDAPVDRLVRDGEFSIQLPNVRVQPDVGVDGEVSLPERYRRVFEDRTSLVGERPTAIRTQIPVKRSIDAVFEHREFPLSIAERRVI